MTRWPLRGAWACLLLMLAAASPQGIRAQQSDSARAAAERVRERLRTLRPLAAPDTLIAVDSTRRSPDRIKLDSAGAAAPSTGAPQAGPGMARDSIMDLLARLTGFVSTEYRGEEAAFEADSGRLQLRRNAAVLREGQQITADSSVTYNETTGIACGYGRPTVTGTGLDAPLTSDTVCYNIHERLGVARNAETSMAQGANWRLRAPDFYTVSDTVYSHDAVFTDCDLPWYQVHYHFGAKEVKVVRNNTLVARNVTLNFDDVPVFWLPFMVQSLSRGRRSGLLMPRFGVNDIVRNSSRYNRRIEDVGVYWAINDFMGAEVALDWMSDNYTAVRGSFDYRVLSSFLSGGLTFRRFWKTEGGTELTVATVNSWEPDERTSLRVNGSYTTSSAFVRNRSLDPRELNRSIDSNASLSRSFDWGRVTLGATRKQWLHDGTVLMTLPTVSANLSGIPLFPALPGSESWYSNGNWTVSADAQLDRQDVNDNSRNLTAQPYRRLQSNLNSSITIGKFNFSQTFALTDEQTDERSIASEERDTTFVLPGREQQQMNYNTSLSFQQRLIGTSVLTPSVRLRGEAVRNEKTGPLLIGSPVRMDFSTLLRTDLYGFWPGLGPLERIRHKLSPSFTYTYSPAPSPNPVQAAIFTGLDAIREQNTLAIGLSQTFEGKRRQTEEERQREAAGDTAVADTSSGPRRMPQGSAPIILLSLSTDAVVYDFVAARETGDGITTTQISNTLTSDLLRNLQLRFTHDLFRTVEATETSEADRIFEPHLSELSASLSLSSDSWLFRMLRLGGQAAMPEEENMAGSERTDDEDAGPVTDKTRSEMGLIGTSRRDAEGSPSGPVGAWTARLNYALRRPRESNRISNESQNLTGDLSFQPTLNWTVRWSTGYDFTGSRFTDHILTLTRRLHDWDANFDFVKAQNGNFSFQFRVHLRANPDIKLDYEQHDLEGIRPRL